MWSRPLPELCPGSRECPRAQQPRPRVSWTEVLQQTGQGRTPLSFFTIVPEILWLFLHVTFTINWLGSRKEKRMALNSQTHVGRRDICDVETALRATRYTSELAWVCLHFFFVSYSRPLSVSNVDDRRLILITNRISSSLCSKPPGSGRVTGLRATGQGRSVPWRLTRPSPRGISPLRLPCPGTPLPLAGLRVPTGRLGLRSRLPSVTLLRGTSASCKPATGSHVLFPWPPVSKAALLCPRAHCLPSTLLFPIILIP